MSSSRPIQNSPWPDPTPAASTSSSSSRRSTKRRRIQHKALEARASTSKSARRQIVADQSEVQTALVNCEFYSGNNVFSCFPTAQTVIPQHQWASFVWNSRRPDLTQTNLVDIFLFRGDSGQQILHFPNTSNPTDQAGLLTAQVNDSWWGTDGKNWNGSNISYPFYWVIIRSDKTLDGNQVAQPTFTAVQTTYADSVIASSSASVASASSASSASAASASASSYSASVKSQGTSPTSAVQHTLNASSSFPHWAIAVIVVLGFLAIVASCVLVFLILRRIRRRREKEESEANRNSMGSASPMMANAANTSPLLGGTAALLPPPTRPGSGGGGGGTLSRHDSQQQLAPSMTHDAESTTSRPGSAGDSGPFSGADAAIMADAFRKMLRKPDFAAAGPVEEGEGPEGQDEQIINRELAEEGRDIRSVSSSRGVKVETLGDSDTAR